MTDESAGRGAHEGAAMGAEEGVAGSPEAIAEARAELELDEGLEVLEQELASLNDRHLRLVAEFDNYRRRVQNEMSESWVRAQADLVRRLLDPLDDLARVALLEPETATVQAIVEGVDMVERKVLKALQEAGAEQVNPEGARFDPATMEAVMKVPASSPEEDDMVHQVFQKGFMFKGHLVRPARVAVLKHD